MDTKNISTETRRPAVVKLAETWIETEEKPTYHGWPTVARLRDGRLAAVCSGHRTKHVDPFGRVYLYTSADNGLTWSAPKMLSNGPLDDRDAGILQLPDGTLLVNYFTSIFFCGPLRDHSKSPESWREVERHVTLAQCDEELGQFLLRSTDGGATWSPKYRVPVGNVHGPCVLRDGSLLWAGKVVDYNRLLVTERYGRALVVCRSEDGGLTWRQISAIPTLEGQDPQLWDELFQLQAPDGTVVCLIRNEAVPNGAMTWQSESTDNGLTWSTPHEICYGVCDHLVNLPDGRMLLSYGYRRAPFGVRFRVSDDCARTWSEEGVLCDDGDDLDLGYPSTVVLDDGTLLTLWYQNRRSRGMASLRCLRWRLEWQ